MLAAHLRIKRLNKAMVDRKTLAWIREGVEETLKSVLQAPDQFAANPDDVSSIQACFAPIHRVKGALKMVGVSGATMLAEELEDLVRALVANKVRHKRDAAEVLATGMLQLPGYLESLYHGQPDMPLILLPILNDLRACQDKELLTEGEFFSPDLSINAPIQAVGDCIVSGEIHTVARKLRPGYLAGLLGLIRGRQVTDSIEKLILVVDNLLIASHSDKARQLWWVALGVIDSLYEKGLEASVAVKILLGRVDRQIQQVSEYGEEVFAVNPPDKLIKNLLYYVAQSETYNNRVLSLKKAFHVDYPDDRLVKKARESLYGFNANLIETIASQVKEEIVTIKCALDVALHAKAGATIGLQDIPKNFSTVADAMGMLGMTLQRDLIHDQRDLLEQRIKGGQQLSEEELMGIAAVLLHVESSMSNLAGSMGQEQEEGSLPRAEYDKLVQLMSKEIISDIKLIKDRINAFAEEPEQPDLLVDVPARMRHITGAMNMLQHYDQGNLSQAIHDFVKGEMVDKHVPVSEIQLDLLADAITGMENFFQSVLEESVAPDIGLKVANDAMTQLGYAPKVSSYDAAYNKQASS